MDLEGTSLVIGGERGARLTVSPLWYERTDSPYEDDLNWVFCEIEVKSGAFHGHYRAFLDRRDFAGFEQELRHALERLSGRATFSTIEAGLGFIVDIKDTTGRAYVKGEAGPLEPPSTTLSFEFDSDQTFLQSTLRNLETIRDRLPVVRKDNKPSDD